MTPDLARLRRLVETLEWPTMVIGGLAVAARGRPRMTADADITIAMPEGAEEDLVRRCLAAGFRPLPEEPLDFVRARRVLPLQADDGTRVDAIVAGSPYEIEAIGRSTDVAVQGVTLRMACAEDVVIHKVVAGRERDIEDARSVVQRSGASFDPGLVRRVIVPLAEAIADDDLRRRMEDVLSSGG